MPKKDPCGPVTITIPRSLKHAAKKRAEEMHLSLSAYVATIIREKVQIDARADN